MLGAITGDIVGSVYEWRNTKKKDFIMFAKNSFFTDDSVMTVAVAASILECEGNYGDLSKVTVKNMQQIGRLYPDCGYGGNFAKWIFSRNPEPYYSYGNGAAMRVSPCGFAAKTLDGALELARAVTSVSHNHPEGIKGALATSGAVFLARTGKSKEEIKEYICENFYKIDFTLDKIREKYTFDVSCQGSVPQALEAFFESVSFEDTIRNAVSIGGDSDTIAAIAGGVAEAYYGIPEEIYNRAIGCLDDPLRKTVSAFEAVYPTKITK